MSGRSPAGREVETRAPASPEQKPLKKSTSDTLLTTPQGSGESTVVMPPKVGPAPPAPMPTHTVGDGAANTTAEALATSCPECGAALPQLGWCARCGYSRHTQPKQEVPPETPEEAASRFAALFESTEAAEPPPSRDWVAILICGLVVIVFGSLLAAINLRSEARGQQLWCVGEASLGAALLAFGYVWGFLQVSPPGQRLLHLHKFMSSHLLRALWQRLPQTQWPVCLIIWGIAGCMSALLILILVVPT